MLVALFALACRHPAPPTPPPPEPPPSAPRPVADRAADPPVSVEVGPGFGCVLRESGAVSCFGEVEPRSGWFAGAWTSPPLDGVALGVGAEQWCVLDRAGVVRCDLARMPYGVVVPLGGPADRLAVGGTAACARVGDDWWCWGGDLSTPLPWRSRFETDPAPVPELAGAERVLLNGTSCAVWPDGHARCWGQLRGGRTPVDVPFAPDLVGFAEACRRTDDGLDCLSHCRSSTPTLDRLPCAATTGEWIVDHTPLPGLRGAAFDAVRCVLDAAGALSCTPSPYEPGRVVATGVRAFDVQSGTACWLDAQGVGCLGLPLVREGVASAVPLPFRAERLWRWGPNRTCASSETEAACWGAGQPMASVPGLAGCEALVEATHRARCAGRWVAVGPPRLGTGPYPDEVVRVAAGLGLRADGSVVQLEDGAVLGPPGRFVDLAGTSEIAGLVWLDADGVAWRWSSGTFGAVGPVRIEGLPPLRAVFASWALFLGLDREGGLWAWGRGTATPAEDDWREADRAASLAHAPLDWPGPAPRRVLTDVADVATGAEAVALAIRTDGSGWCLSWQGTGRAPCRSPTERVGGLEVGRIHPGPLAGAAVGETAWCALVDGAVECFGEGPPGTLGEPLPGELQVQRVPL